MKVILLAPLPGYSHFEGEVINLPNKVAEEAIEKKLAEPFCIEKPVTAPAEKVSNEVEKPSKPAKKK